jgi:hypothetical protein
MGCCGEKRATLRTRMTVTRTLREPAVDAGPAPQLERQRPGDVAVEYLGEVPVVVRGGASGRVYTFSPSRRVGSVSSPDAHELRGNPLFRPAGGMDEATPDRPRATRA